jgi:DNA polymerase-3 subunit gamma/tau
MESVSLYRKYRPQDWKDVLGQEHIVKVLDGSIKNGKIAHAYLFSGSRGTGKTSVARIFARALGTSSNDLYEIDAASNRGVDDVRELRDGVRTLPLDSKYKIYILDEVHMLTKEAFNALLKTLEEPPAHAIFILATTELQKVPETIRSRCQTFEFKRPTRDVLKTLVIDTAKKEKKKITAESAEMIALLGDGSFRDTYGILQKVVSYSKDEKIDPDEVLTVTGAPSVSLVREFLDCIARKELSMCLVSLRTAEESGGEAYLFLKIVLMKIRTALLIRYAPALRKTLEAELGESEYEYLKKMEESAGKTLSSKLLEYLLEAETKIKFSPIPTLPIESALVKYFEEE